MVIKKLILLTLALSACFSNLAYASSGPSCAQASEGSIGLPGCHAEQKPAPSKHSCCPSGACACSVEERSNEQAMPATPAVIRHDGLEAALPGAISSAVLPESFDFRKTVLESPHNSLPLYALFSVYRL